MSLCVSVGHETALLMQTLTQDHKAQNTNEAEIRGNRNDYNQSVSQSINQSASQSVSQSIINLLTSSITNKIKQMTREQQ